jgi:hypothetical protein
MCCGEIRLQGRNMKSHPALKALCAELAVFALWCLFISVHKTLHTSVATAHGEGE